jgi:pimeloyl-ACP methyl ester carboxylesterase
MNPRFEVQTSLGPVWLLGRDTGRPILLLVTGAFAAADLFWRMQDHFPDADVLRLHLPGNHCPELAETSIHAFAAAIDEALAGRWPDRPLMAVGLSVGGVVALALRNPMLRRLVVVEPVLLTQGVWPLELYRAQAPAGGGTFVRNIFGVGPDEIRPVDHGWVLEGLTVPTLALVGDAPLGAPRPFERMPTLVSAEALARLQAHPAIEVEVVPGAGHNIPRDAEMPLHRAIVRSWRAAFPPAS